MEIPQLLRAKWHEVYAPTLTGCGERIHLAHPNVGLETYILHAANITAPKELTELLLEVI